MWEGQLFNQEVQRISEEKVRATKKRMKSRKAVSPDDIPVEVQKCLGDKAVDDCLYCLTQFWRV